MKKAIFILLLCLAIPASAAEIQKDKLQHFGGGALISLGVASYAHKAGWKHPKLWGLGAALTAGLLKEALDSRRGGTGFDAADALATGAGGLTVSIAFRF